MRVQNWAEFAESVRRFTPVFARFVPPDRAPRAAEWSTRVLLAYLHPDRAPFVMTDPDAHAETWDARLRQGLLR